MAGSDRPDERRGSDRAASKSALAGNGLRDRTDRTGQIVAVAGHQDARVALGDRTIKIGPLDDCRGVSLSPDGKWLATSNHQVAA